MKGWVFFKEGQDVVDMLEATLAGRKERKRDRLRECYEAPDKLRACTDAHVAWMEKDGDND